jgi:flagellar hook-basal body complex protein FliE
MNTVSFGNIPNVSMPSAGALEPGIDKGGASFSEILKNAVNTVNSLHDGATAQVQQLMQNGSGDLNQVMIAVEKADVSFELMMQVRNKIVSAYQDIEKMQF